MAKIIEVQTEMTATISFTQVELEFLKTYLQNSPHAETIEQINLREALFTCFKRVLKDGEND